MPNVEVHISYAAPHPLPLRYITKLTCTSLSGALLHTEEGPDANGFDVELPRGSWVHQETKAMYTGGAFALQVKDFQVGGGTEAPSDIEVTWDEVCISRNQPIQLVVAGVTNEDEEVPLPNGNHQLTWKETDQEWQYIMEVEEWGPSRSGFLFGVTCSNGNYYRRVIVNPSGEPIGGGIAPLDDPVILDSGGAGFEDAGTAIVKFTYPPA